MATIDLIECRVRTGFGTPSTWSRSRSGAVLGLVLMLVGLITPPPATAIDAVLGMLPVVDPANLYSETNKLSPAVAGALMRQDIRISPDGKTFFVADMKAGGVFLIDGDAFKEVRFIPTGVGTHGLYPSRDGTKLYIANRGSARVSGPPRGKGSVSVMDFATHHIVATWPMPRGGSPDMGNVSVDGKTLWLSGRYDNVVYAIDTTTGQVRSIPVGKEPHGMTVWPQPGRYSLGHTGNMR